MSTLLKKWYKSHFPALNVHRRDELVAMDTIYSDTPAVDSGATISQVFVGVESLVTNVYVIKTDRQFINTLEDQIWTWGAPTKLISDWAQLEISNQVRKSCGLTALMIGRVSPIISIRTLLNAGSSS